MRKFMFFLVILLCFVSFTVFASGQSAAPQPNAPVELVYWSHYGQSPAFVQAFGDSATAALQKMGIPNASCRVEIIEYSGYQTKYISAFAAGNGPDLFLARASDYALEGGVNPIALPLPADVEKLWTDALAPSFKTNGMFNGKRYGFPVEGSFGVFLYINTDHFREAGLDPARDYPKTLDQLLEVAKKLTKYDASGKITRSGYHPRFLGEVTGTASKFNPILHNFGGSILSPDLKSAQGYYNSPESIAAFQWYQDMVTVHKVVNLEFGAPETAFQQGLTSMMFREGYFGADTMAKAPNINFMIVPFPAGVKDIAPGSEGAPWSNMINSQSKNVELCVSLFRELVKPEYDITMHRPDSYPPIMGATMTMANEYFKTLLYAEAAMGNMTKQPFPYLYDITPKYTSVATIAGETIGLILNGANVKAALDDAASRMQVVLNQK